MAEEKVYNMREARARLSQLLEESLRGEHVILRRATDGAEVELVPHIRTRVPGRHKGAIRFTPDAFAPLGPDELADWEKDG